MKFLKKKSVIISLVVLALIIVFFVVEGAKPEIPEFSSQTIERIDLKQTVSETGSVEAELELMYGWESSGKVAKIYMDVGDVVTSSHIIAQLGNAQQQARLNEAFAALSSAQAKLNLDLAGPSKEAKQKSSAAVEQAKASLNQSEANLIKVQAQVSSNIVTAQKALDAAKNNLQLVENGGNSELINDAYADLVNALKSALTKLESALSESDSVLGVDDTFANEEFDDVLSLLNTSALNEANGTYLDAKNAKEATAAEVNSLFITTDHASVDAAYAVANDALAKMQSHLYDVQQVLNATRAIGNLSQSELETLKTNISVEQTSIDTSATTVTNAKQSITTASNTLTSYHIAHDKAVSDLEQTNAQAAADVSVARAQVSAQEANVAQAQASYDDLVAPPRSVDVASLRADVSRQAANVSALRDDFEKTKLVALTTGIISTLDVEVGENVSANQEVVGIISEALTIKVDISESDIAKVSIDDGVFITLDAYGDTVEFAGKVIQIEPAETEISGVVYYKTTILFNGIPEEYDVRSGMTANVNILTDVREGVLVVPRRAILTQDGKKIIRVVKNAERGEFEEREVTTGLTGDDGVVEVLSGLSEGEEIVTFLKEE